MSDGGGEEVPDFDDNWADGGESVPSPDAQLLPVNGTPAEVTEAFELIAQPTRVQKVEIGYAKVAKQVDVGALKRSLWELLADEPSSAEPSARRMTSEASFQEIVARLPEKIPEQKLPDLSIAYNFICLLHLANEKGLEIVGQPDLKDLRVKQPVKP